MGLTHLDAGVIIGFLDADDADHSAARATLTRALIDGDQVAMAASALAECLVAPAREGDSSIQIVRDVLKRLPVAIADLNADIATYAAGLQDHQDRIGPTVSIITTPSLRLGSAA